MYEMSNNDNNDNNNEEQAKKEGQKRRKLEQFLTPLCRYHVLQTRRVYIPFRVYVCFIYD